MSNGELDLGKAGRVKTDLAMKAGDVFYTKKAWKFSEKSGVVFTCKPGQHFIGVLIGSLPNRVEIPDATQIMGLLGEIGMVGLDDVELALGVEAQEKLLKFIEEKYNPHTKAIVTPEQAKQEGIVAP